MSDPCLEATPTYSHTDGRSYAYGVNIQFLFTGHYGEFSWAVLVSTLATCAAASGASEAHPAPATSYTYRSCASLICRQTEECIPVCSKS